MPHNFTGPELFEAVGGKIADAEMETPGSPLELSDLARAQLMATQAQTAAFVMLAGLYADAHGIRSRELEVWSEVIPSPPLVKCWGKETRRPECAERHTDDCNYADPVPEPKHELLPVGTVVLVSDPHDTNCGCGNEQPWVGKIAGYDLHKSKYQINEECYGHPGEYYDFVRWVFADNRVQPHPEQPTPEQPEPIGPRMYVRNPRGKQGHVLDMRMRSTSSTDRREARVQWYAPGARPVWIDMDLLTFITADEVQRCPNGQTGDECGSGENQCEPCLQNEDAEGDEIEESMGLR